MKTCSSCGAYHASNAESCPNCGHVKTPWYIWPVLIVFVIVMLSIISMRRSM